MSLAGRTLAGRYDVLELLGVGGMGSVYRAHDRELDELIALKVIRPDRRLPGMVELFRHEVKLARRVTHVNVARTFELGFDDDIMFCTMELVEGESLRERLERTRSLPASQATAIARALCKGLDAAHTAGVIHRDIKPANVLLTAAGRVVLADFGVAAITRAETGGTLAGTLEYMAPEQASGDAPSPASDVYSVGVVLFEMLSGTPAFAGTMSQLVLAKQDLPHLDVTAVARLPDGLAQVVARATARDVSARYKTAHELADALAPWEDATLPVVTARPPLAPLATVIVLAPRLASGHRLHLAEGVHQELLRRLAQQPRLRVWPRVVAPEQHEATVVSLDAGDTLAVTIARKASTTRLELPLDVAHVDVTAGAIAGAVSDAIASHATARGEAYELLLKGRAAGRKGFVAARETITHLKAAYELDPDDPVISANFASWLVRYAFGGAASYPEGQALVPALVQRALTVAPQLAETHVAAANLELQTGDPVIAAIEFRTAIACSPYLAESHEGLGRMLLEAGFLRDAAARLEDAFAIAPELNAVRWEIARAHALEQNWPAHDALIEELLRQGDDRYIARFRFAIWRNDRETMVALRTKQQRAMFDAEMYERIFVTVLDNGYPRVRQWLRDYAGQGESSNRRRAFRAQAVAEAAGFAGDAETVLAMLRVAIEEANLFDLHWLDHAPTIAVARHAEEFARLRSIVKHRADRIHDALFGERLDNGVTVVA